ncbi:MAG: TOBE domain-containing protein [Defluviicoccus sp.]|nr:TOBE domain-containing protein [Defluviicoccus sp.]MDE0382254.1 TOBE domain-containing protein [Defluviicoccus sp.]
MSLHTARPEGPGIENLFEGEVVDTIYLGSFLEGRVRVGRHEIAIRIDHYEEPAPGQTIHLSFRPEHGLCLTG